MDKYKVSLAETFEQVALYAGEHEVTVAFKGEEVYHGKLSREGYRFVLTISPALWIQSFNDVTSFRDYDVEITLNYDKKLSAKIWTTSVTPGATVKYIVDSWQLAGVNHFDANYFRMVVPAPESQFHYHIQELGYESETHWHRAATQIQIDGCSLHVLIVKYGDMQYMLFDCAERLQKAKFIELVDAAQVAICFCLGLLENEQRWIFEYDEKLMMIPIAYEWNGIGYKLNSSHYTPVHTNLYAFNDSNNGAHILATMPNGIPLVSINTLSYLANKSFNSPEYKAMLMLIVEAMSQSLLSMAINLSVVLEFLLKIYGYEKTADTQFEEKILLKLIQEEVLKIVPKSNFQDRLIEKIKEVYNPMLREKARWMFESAGLQLTDNELKVLTSRNIFLHGNFSKIVDKNGPVAESRLYATALELHSLLALLILRKADYRGYTVNYSNVYISGRTGLPYRPCNISYSYRLGAAKL
jgi:hypothetical protein